MAVTVKIKKDFGKVKKYVKDSVIATFGDASRIIQSIARKSIKRRSGDNYSRPGEAPKTRRGDLRRAIQYDVDNKRQEAIIGPLESRMGPAAAVHEHGGTIKGQMFDKRPYMAPALERIAPKLPKLWQFSVK